MRMCMNGTEPLTLAGMMSDPLIRLVMHSDGVAPEEFEALWRHAGRSTARRTPPRRAERMERELMAAG